MTVQGAGAAHQTLLNVVCDPPPEPPVRNEAAPQLARDRRRLAQPGIHAAASSAMRIALSEIIFFPGVKEHRNLFFHIYHRWAYSRSHFITT